MVLSRPPLETTSTASVLIPGRRVTFDTEDQVREIPARQEAQHTPEIDPCDPDLTLPLRLSTAQGDHDNVPDRVPPAKSSAAREADGTTSPDMSTTDGSLNKNTTSSDTEGTSDSNSDSSESSSSSGGSEPSSPLHASTPSADTADSQQEQITPQRADTSMQAMQFYGELLG